MEATEGSPNHRGRHRTRDLTLSGNPSPVGPVPRPPAYSAEVSCSRYVARLSTVVTRSSSNLYSVIDRSATVSPLGVSGGCRVDREWTVPGPLPEGPQTRGAVHPGVVRHTVTRATVPCLPSPPPDRHSLSTRRTKHNTLVPEDRGSRGCHPSDDQRSGPQPRTRT